MNIADCGIELPTNGQWMDVPRSPFQVKTNGSDEWGKVLIRVRPAWSAYWEEFMDSKDWEDPGAV